MLLMAATAAVHSFGADVLQLGELMQEDCSVTRRMPSLRALLALPDWL
jgi:hypothetical protein